MSGLLNQASSPVVGRSPATDDTGSLASGIAEDSGVDLGMFNVSAEPAPAAVISGFGSLGGHVSGVRR